jgi:hypothetical protein
VIGQVLAETRLTGALGSDTSSCSSTKACPSADKFARWRVKRDLDATAEAVLMLSLLAVTVR